MGPYRPVLQGPSRARGGSKRGQVGHCSEAPGEREKNRKEKKYERNSSIPSFDYPVPVLRGGPPSCRLLAGHSPAATPASERRARGSARGTDLPPSRIASHAANKGTPPSREGGKTVN